MSHSVQRRIAVIFAIVLSASFVIPSLAQPASAAGNFHDQGTASNPAPTENSATDLEFFLTTCPDMPSTQGLDAWVFALPSGMDTTGATATITASNSAGDYDLESSAYLADCTFDNIYTDGNSSDLSIALQPDTGFISVWTTTGSDTTFDLTVTPGGGGPATTSAPPTTTAPPPPPQGTRGTYPLQPNDTWFASRDVINDGQWGIRKIQAPQAWQEPQATGYGVVVADLDTGLDLDHEDFQCPGKIEVLPGSDMIDGSGDKDGPEDLQGHGTHTAGIIGACTNNGKGVAGVAPDSTIMPVRVLDAAGSGTSAQIAAGIQFAADHGADVINMSLGVKTAVAVADNNLGLGLTDPIPDAVAYAISKGVVIAAAAGNESSPLCSDPAFFQGVICVGSTDTRDLNAYYGNFPVKTDDSGNVGPGVMAPGGSGTEVFCDRFAETIVSTYPPELDTCDEGAGGLGYRNDDGTSMATPHVAGLAALLYDRLGGVRSPENAQTIVNAIINNTDDLYAPGYDPMSGYGRINALKAVQSIAPVGGGTTTSPSPSPSGSTTASPSPSTSSTPPPITPTAVGFTSDVPATGQYSDSLHLGAKLTDASGNPIANQPLTFQLIGDNDYIQSSATTNDSGIAKTSLELTEIPGNYHVAVAYSGETGKYDQSNASQAFTVVKEDSALAATSAGNGSKKTVSATLTDADNAASGISQAALVLYADGSAVGNATTNGSGVAQFSVPAGSRGNKTVYEVRYAGDDYYRKSSANAS